MHCSAIIVAAGRGTRAESDIPKQYRSIAGKPILAHTIAALSKSAQITEITCVIHPDDTHLYQDAVAHCDDPRLTAPVFGGANRSDSVQAGLAQVRGDYVLIHDAARPFLPQDALDRLLAALKDEPAAFLALPVTDALWRGARAEESVARDALWRAQTPQAFHTQIIRDAYAKADEPAADDIAIARAMGISALPVLGAEENFKITHPDDFARAEAMLKSPMDIRVGNGFDVHALGEGDHVILNGVKIPFDKSMIGHSDADVAMHAITDAIFGALSLGDIGTHFPPSDPQWKGAASDIFLKHAMGLATGAGYRVSQIDCTIICEQPKIGPHANAMRDSLAQITGIETSRISVKATTSEKLGFTGRAEGIAAQATATLVSL
ncbi:MAG: bifunctional 2-C-methyl-D-erythritol 4-phosphate cytidylyltransferase/2-C-methyl-D-erythritol 2,4-cyclodiphosphate synthase [Pseudomonadota bacterium]